MTCVTCGTVGPAEATWCPQCYLPYVRAGAVPQQASTTSPTWAVTTGSVPPPPAYPPPSPVAANAFSAPNAFSPLNPFAAAPNALAAPPVYGQPVYGPPPGAQFLPQVWPAKLGLVVPEYAVQTGDLPRICVISGRPTETMYKMRWLWAPSWTWIFVFLGLFPALIVRYLAGDKVAGYLPVHPTVRRKCRWFTSLGALALLVGFFTAIGGLADSQAVAALLGVALLVGGGVAVFIWGQKLPVRRAAPGFVALPKASPEFAAAFKVGRPARQVPYSTEPLKFRTSTVVKVLGAVCAVLIGIGLVLGIHQGVTCGQSAVHPNIGTVNTDFAQSRARVAAITAQTQGQGLTMATAQALAAEHEQLLAQLQTVHLSAPDTAAIDDYGASLQSYDSKLLAAMQPTISDTEANAELSAANSQLDSDSANLNAALHVVPARCANN
jgi:hypothetical protein